MSLDFPSSPTPGDRYPTPPIDGLPVYTWDGEKWLTASGSIATAPPAVALPLPDAIPALVGTATKYAREDHVHPEAGVSVNAAQSLTATQQTQARSNIYAAPFDAMAYSGMQINGGMEVSQELGALGRSTIGYVCDGWAMYYTGTMVTSSAAITSTDPVGFPNRLVITTSPAQASLGAGDYSVVVQTIEGYRLARLAWGTTSAQPITISFWSCHNRTGLFSVSIRNGALNRSYVGTYTQAAAAVWQYNTITIPGDTTGTWAKDNTGGMNVAFSNGAGTTLTASSANIWLTGSYQAAPGQVNNVASTSDFFRITGVTVLPGTQAPTAAQSSNIMRPYGDELTTCQRYWCSSYPLGVVGGTPGIATNLTMTCDGTTVLGGSYAFPVEMRASPTIKMWGYSGAVNAWSNTGGTDITTGTLIPTSKAISTGYSAVVLPVGGIFLTHFQADARL